MNQKDIANATYTLQPNLNSAQPFDRREREKNRYGFKNSLIIAIVLTLVLNGILSRWSARSSHDQPATQKGSRSGCKENGVDDDEFDWSSLTPSNELQWAPCYKGFQCARLSVPLDYSEPSGEKAAIALTKWPAKVSSASTEYRGPILFNPGGPGGSGVATILSNAKPMEKILGSDYDLIGFDPRGVGFTTPQFSPFTGQPAAAAWAMQQITDANFSTNGVGLLHAQAQVTGQLALDNARKAGQHMSTAVVARDMLSITRAHGLEKLQYWGFSYGTVLGATYAAMFPDNVGRVVIDGVVDLENYYAALWSNNLKDTDAELEFIYESCAKASPDACALHENSSSLVAERVNKLIHKLNLSPLGFRNNQTGDYGVIRGSDVRIAIFRTLYSPYTNAKRLVDAIAALEEGNPQPLFELDFSGAILNEKALECSCPSSSLMRSAGRIDKATEAIACGEGDVISDTSEELEAYYVEMAKVSQFSYLWLAHGSCSGWKIRAKEIFNGPFVANTSHPLLLIGNTLDPVTPVWNAHKVAKGYKDSVVLTQNSAGHCSPSAVSLCTVKYVRAYFHNGTLPPADTVCEVESALFSDDQSSFMQDMVSTLSAEDVELLNAATSLQEANFVVKHV